MKTFKSLLIVILLLPAYLAHGQKSIDPWEKWNFLIGEWIGEHNGQPGQNEGKFTFYKDLDGKILVRKNHTVLPSTSTAAEVVHDDLLIIYQEGIDSQEAIYFDNEGHTIKYKVTYADQKIILTSDIIPNSPRFRFTYTIIDPKTVNSSFEFAPPNAPEVFNMYLEGKAFKK
jgi:hypothetical protein